jgi:pimeloyl-ACP methyl ester carboxylesterase
MATAANVETRTVKVSGASLYVEVRGTGPILLCITGGPTDAGMFADLAARLSGRFTVVTYDQRGHSRSPLDSESGDVSVALHTDDAAAILASMGDQPAYVYGNSGGGTIGIDLVTRYSERVRTFVAHEAPVLELLPDAERLRSVNDDIQETYRTDGVFPAMAKFGASVEEGGPKYSEEMGKAPPTPESQEMMGRMTGNFDLFLAQELTSVTRYAPDIKTLRKVSTRIVSAAGETSGEQSARRAAIALAERLEIPSTSLPGAHGGWGSDPQEFAQRLQQILVAG